MQYTLRGKISNITPLTLDKTLLLEGASADAKAVGDAIKGAEQRVTNSLNLHNESKANPHNVTAVQIGLGNCDNTADIDKPVSKAQAEAIKEVSESLGSAKAETETYPGVFLTSGWSEEAPFTQEITVEGVLANDNPFVDIDLSEVEDVLSVIEAWSYVGRCTVSEDNKVIAYCYQEKPEVDMPVLFKVVR